MRYCFVISHGRSGSTLVQAALNSLEGWCIRGENEAVLVLLRNAYDALLRAKFEFGGSSYSPASPWYGIGDVSGEQLREEVRGFIDRVVLRPAPGTKVSGYKEVRYGPETTPNITNWIDWMRSVFPNSSFIFIVRSIEDTARSGWWAGDPEAPQYLQEFQQGLRAAYDAHSEVSFFTTYEEITQSAAGLKRLFSWLGEDVPEAKIAKILSHKVSQWDPVEPSATPTHSAN
jgi:hypothetical protein